MAKRRKTVKTAKRKASGQRKKSGGDDTVMALVIVVVLVIAFAGLYLYQQNKKTSQIASPSIVALLPR